MTVLAMQPEAPDIATLTQQLCERGWCVSEGLIEPSLIADLRADACTLFAQQAYRQAAVGAPGATVSAPAVRGDWILWLEGGSAAQQRFLAAMDRLRTCLQEQLRTALGHFDAHYACYPPGRGYEQHYDNAQGRNTRLLTVTTYLNANWRPGDGGELVLFDNDQSTPVAMLQPKGGTTVILLSRQVPHQVLAAHSQRWSVTGWFVAPAAD